MAESEKFVFFWSGPFSQFAAAPFDVEGVSYPTAEHFMMRQKALLFGDAAAARDIMAARKPEAAKALGRRVRGFDGAVWDARKVAIVTAGSEAKYSQNRGLRRKLFQTLGATLVEASPLDAIWGIGLSADDPRARDRAHWLGENLLGRILTDVRDRLAEAHPDEAAAVERDHAAMIDAAA